MRCYPVTKTILVQRTTERRHACYRLYNAARTNVCRELSFRNHQKSNVVGLRRSYASCCPFRSDGEGGLSRNGS